MKRELLIAINQMMPGDVLNVDGQLLVCRESMSYLSGYNCTHCALFKVNCNGVACMKGMPTPRGYNRPKDVYFSLYYQ